MSKILVVDDDLVVLATVSMGLRNTGYEVLQVDTEIAALHLAEKERPDLVILDIRMPGMGGIKVAEILRERFKLPFIFLTAFSGDDMVRTAAEAGALGYLVKPLEVFRIVPVIETALLRAQEREVMEGEIASLNHALDRNREIDVAVGRLMERYGVERDQAFEALRRHARSRRCKIAEVAKQIIEGKPVEISLEN